MGLFDFFKKRIDESVKAAEKIPSNNAGNDDFTQNIVETANFFVERTSKNF